MANDQGPFRGGPASASRLDIEKSGRGDDAVVKLAGEVDLRTAPKLADCLKDLANLGVHRVVVDLSRVGFIDSSALRALVFGRKALSLAGGELRLRGLSRRNRRILELRGLAPIFPIE